MLYLIDPGLQANVLQDLAKHHLYTFILLSTPSTKALEVDESPVYEATFDDSVHMDLKRSLYPRAGGRNSSIPTDTRPLFEKYQFLTPGMLLPNYFEALLMTFRSFYGIACGPRPSFHFVPWSQRYLKSAGILCCVR